jgi:diguanylate cyclase (GGDEF)-like protein
MANLRGEALSAIRRSHFATSRTLEASPDPADHVMQDVTRLRSVQLPQSRPELKTWLEEHLDLTPDVQFVVFAAIDSVFTRHKQLLEASKDEALQALSARFAYKIARLQRQLSEKKTDAGISQYLEKLVTDLTHRSRRDPTTKLMSFARFTHQCRLLLSLEQRSGWCAIGMAGIARLKFYNDTHGHAVSNLIIGRVAQLLREQARSDDLHSRFGADEFCFLIPGLRGPEKAYAIGERFREAVERYDWTLEDRQLSDQPVRIDVGVAGIRLGKVAERRFIARRLAADLIVRADKLMSLARKDPVSRIRLECVRIQKGELVPITGRS